jgi:hypothetical protein
VARPKRPKIQAVTISEGPLKASTSQGANPTPSPPKNTGHAASPRGTDHPRPSQGVAGDLSSAGAGAVASDSPGGPNQDRLSVQPKVGASGEKQPVAPDSKEPKVPVRVRPDVANSPAQAEKADGDVCSLTGRTPAKIDLGTPDMRAVGTWVIRHLESDSTLYASPDPMADTLLAACKADPKFRSVFVSKVFDRMMVQDQSQTQNKFNDNNEDLRGLLDAVEIAAKAAK